MADKVLDNNQVNIVGVVDSEFTYSHEVFGEGFYIIEVMVNRLSNMADLSLIHIYGILLLYVYRL